MQLTRKCACCVPQGGVVWGSDTRVRQRICGQSGLAVACLVATYRYAISSCSDCHIGLAAGDNPELTLVLSSFPITDPSVRAATRPCPSRVGQKLTPACDYADQDWTLAITSRSLLMKWKIPKPLRWLLVIIVLEWMSAIRLLLNLQFSTFAPLSNAGMVWTSFGLCAAHAFQIAQLADPLRVSNLGANMSSRLSRMISAPSIVVLVVGLLWLVHLQASSRGWPRDAELTFQYIAVALGLQIVSVFVFRAYRRTAV